MSSTGAGAAARHDYDADVMRVLASIGVIAIHSSISGTVSGILIDSFARFSVPVFVMISGYYMLGSRPESKKLAAKCGRLFGLMIFWSGVYYGCELLRGEQDFTGLRAMLKYLLAGPVHFWYIYAIITLYVFTPALWVFAEHAGRSEYRRCLLMTFILGSPVLILIRSGWIPAFEEIVSRTQIPFPLGMIFMYLFGGYLRRYDIGSAGRGALYALGTAGAVFTAAGTVYLTSRGGGGTNTLLQSFFAPGVLMQGTAVFVFCKSFLQKHPIRSEKLRAIIRFLAGETMGIYLIHPLVIRIVKTVPMPDFIALTIALRTLLVFAVCALVVGIFRKIPVLKRIV